MKQTGKSVRLFTEKHMENIESMFRLLYKDELLTDVTLHCKDGSIKAHKIILASCSRYFRKVFLEHADGPAVFIMHGITISQMKSLMELIYKGTANVASDLMTALYGIAEELQIGDVIVDSQETDKSRAHGRDTRFRGQKRVTVDFKDVDQKETIPSKVQKYERKTIEKTIKKEPVTNGPTPSIEPEKLSEIVSTICTRLVGQENEDTAKKTVWALKQRKYKCDLCPSSFKRASHLNRHQLVHTGERPYACDQCEKAFSRHDKLKNHIKKTHDLDSLNDALPPDSLYTIGHVQILTPEQTMVESPTPIRREDLTPQQSESQAPSNLQSPSGLPGVSGPVVQKKGRGRPRKYPPVPPPLIKRPRGRPRLNPLVGLQEPKKEDNYDITNMPYGDLEYLTKPVHEESIEETVIMEPLVEIKTEPIEKYEESPLSASTFLENIGLLENSSIGKIGECTISVANIT